MPDLDVVQPFAASGKLQAKKSWRREMPSFFADIISEAVTLEAGEESVYEPPHRVSHDRSSIHSAGTTELPRTVNSMNGSSALLHLNTEAAQEIREPTTSPTYLPNGRSSGSTFGREKAHSTNGSNQSIESECVGRTEAVRQSTGLANGLAKRSVIDRSTPLTNGNETIGPNIWPRPSDFAKTVPTDRSRHKRGHSLSAPQSLSPREDAPNETFARTTTSSPFLGNSNREQDSQAMKHYSSPPILPPSKTASVASSSPITHPGPPPRLQHRHTLQVPRLSASRLSHEIPSTAEAFDGAPNRIPFSPTTPAGHRPSLSIVRRPTRSIQSDIHLDDGPPDSDMERWTETIRQKRASRRKRKEEEEDDDRVVVGTRVDMNHVNWVTAYNMLTGIRFTVSRTNAKLDRDLTDADFDARHKFSFDITGNELTPSAKYDFKFKDYAPWVFRHLRAKFKLDPADYLMSLTSKYILSELGSPGKSGSFFYFSRDYKYIIKTIHHGEHKLLRKILREYYAHVERYPNTLISQFYGLHRVKIPYGKKIHFVIMNNLFPPHRDIHQTFDLKGSTVGRDYREEDLERNPRATLKDLNWLRRGYHFEFGGEKKQLFIEQMERDVALLQKLKIMDYSLLVGIHDLRRGNEENLRDKTLQVFQPGGERSEEPQPSMLTRTPSKLETARKARELRQIIRREKPVPMDQSTSKMPDEIFDEERKSFIFYSDDGGFRASHDDGSPGEEIYYLGIIDCLTHYGVVKKAEHFWKGMSHDRTQISPVPPRAYGDRFVKFMTGCTMTREEAEKEKQSGDQLDGSIHTNRQSSQHFSRTSVEKVIDRAEHQAHKSERHGAFEDESQDRTLTSVRSPSAERSNGIAGATLPVVEEVGEAGSTGGRSARSMDGSTRNEISDHNPILHPDR